MSILIMLIAAFLFIFPPSCREYLWHRCKAGYTLQQPLRSFLRKTVGAKGNLCLRFIMNHFIYTASEPADKLRNSIQPGHCLSIFQIRDTPICFAQFFGQIDLPQATLTPCIRYGNAKGFANVTYKFTPSFIYPSSLPNLHLAHASLRLNKRNIRSMQ